MEQAPPLDLIAMIHLIMLSLWGGVVATEAVIEVYPFRRPELHTATIRLHLWIDLLVELPLVLAVIVTGSILLYLTDPVTPLHLIKVAFGGAAIGVNLFCIGVVVRRARRFERIGDDRPLWRASQTVLACFAAGLLCAVVAAAIGFRLGIARLS